MKDEFILTLNNPITEEQWDTITDVDFEHTNEITFHTKHGKKVVFVKKSAQPRKPGHWETYIISMIDGEGCRCSECGFEGVPYWDFCPNCGADMRGEG